MGAIRLAVLLCAVLAAGLSSTVSHASPRVPASIRVSGDHLVDLAGRRIRLVGVNHSGSEFKCVQNGTPGNLGWGIFDGPTDLRMAEAIASWSANVVRLPLNEDCWLGINGVNPAYSGPRYRSAIKAYVDTLHEAGLYVILDLHWASPGTIGAHTQQPMADRDHASAFWTSVAIAYKDDLGTLFDLYNEPFIFTSYLVSPGDPWDCWLHGCLLNQYLTGQGQPFTRQLEWRTAGMQDMLDAIRAAGARNVVLAGGLGWAGDLSAWMSHKPSDPLGQLAASWHSYPCDNCSDLVAGWDRVIAPLAAKVPVIIGETGDSLTSPPAFDRLLLPWADAHGLSYLGWTWNTWGDPRFILITDYEGSPSTNYGRYFHDHIAVAAAQPPLHSQAGLPAETPLATAQAKLDAVFAAVAAHPRRLVAGVAILGGTLVGILSLLRVGRQRRGGKRPAVAAGGPHRTRGDPPAPR